MATRKPPIRESVRLAARLMPRDRAERRAFRKAMMAELPPVKRAALSPFWGIVVDLLLAFLPALIELLARLRQDEPEVMAAALDRVASEPPHPITAAVLGG